MRIKSVEVIPLNIPLVEPFEIAIGKFSFAENVLIKVQLEDGTVGYGEVSSSGIITGDIQSTAIDIVKYISPALVGESIERYRYLIKKLRSIIKFHPGTFAGLENAILDAYTNYIGVPLYKFLGGASYEIESDVTLSITTPEKATETALSYFEKGYHIFKLKVGKDFDEDLKRVLAVSEAVPDCEIRVDANQGYTPKEAVRFINKLYSKDVNITLFEQPVYWKDIQGLKFVTDHSPVPVAADETVFTATDAFNVARERVVDVINIKLAKCGGVLEALDIIAVAKASGLELMIGCMVESNIGLAPSVHLACGTGEFSYIDLDSYLFLKELPLKGGFEVDGPRLIVKNIKKGLGIEESKKEK
ncbi:mandelate racemase/muconate lactonizing enzyme family protein [Archaeoglobus profundus]|uniref:Mandelate racemase/muconate lactonizing protein n=1 Tax=Archaeoglobus profundus (strain DSM 5631 / JCM 9629 / NBRC 100127 / Av18) TaxID=572546 RepID=D2REB1_ARCPA|nr:dipeptide epimerase [Archaeoglobus profundus]ADB58455.1 Mandelate racemase/muconate lactonizing protein [Archaeoglobus profundus DSM 5631]